MKEFIGKKVNEFDELANNSSPIRNSQSYLIKGLTIKTINDWLSASLREAYKKGIDDCMDVCDNAVNEEQNKLGEEPKKVQAYKEIRQHLLKLGEG